MIDVTRLRHTIGYQMCCPIYNVNEKTNRAMTVHYQDIWQLAYGTIPLGEMDG